MSVWQAEMPVRSSSSPKFGLWTSREWYFQGRKKNPVLACGLQPGTELCWGFRRFFQTSLNSQSESDVCEQKKACAWTAVYSSIEIEEGFGFVLYWPGLSTGGSEALLRCRGCINILYQEGPGGSRRR